MRRNDMTRHAARWLDSMGNPLHDGSIWCTFENRDLILVQHDHGFVQGHILERDLPNKTIERYRVDEIEFEGRRGLGDWDCWKLHVSKLDSFGSPMPSKNATVAPQYYVSNSQNVQIGNGNAINIQDSLQQLQLAIETSSASQTEKAEAKGLIHKLTHNPLVCAILGGVAAGIGTGSGK